MIDIEGRFRAGNRRERLLSSVIGKVVGCDQMYRPKLGTLGRMQRGNNHSALGIKAPVLCFFRLKNNILAQLRFAKKRRNRYLSYLVSLLEHPATRQDRLVPAHQRLALRRANCRWTSSSG